MSSGENNTVVLITEHSGAMTGLRACVNEQDVRRRRPNAISMSRVLRRTTRSVPSRALQTSEHTLGAWPALRDAGGWASERSLDVRASRMPLRARSVAQVRESGPAAGERRF